MLTVAQIVSIVTLSLVAIAWLCDISSMLLAKKKNRKISMAQIVMLAVLTIILSAMLILTVKFDSSHPITDPENWPTPTMEPSKVPMSAPEPEAEEEFSFADLSKRRFEFSSGIGAWSENFTIEKDGYFTGLFHDSDMGDTGEEYADGTVYTSSYSGHFAEMTKIDEYTYQMKLADITYKKTPGTEEISENIRYVYSDSYCLSGTDTFTVYLPGTPVSELSEDVWMWLRMANQSETELTMIVIADLTNDEAKIQGFGARMLEEKYGAKVYSIITEKDVMKVLCK